MELPNLLEKIKSKPEEPELFLAVEINLAEVKTAVWQVQSGRSSILAVGQIVSWEDDESLITAVDESLSSSMEGQDPDINRVIFSLPETWISGESIAQSHKNSLKRLCDELELKPMGFVVATEAVVNYLAEQEGGPVSAILVRVNDKELLVTLVKLGEIEGTQAVGRSDDVTADVQEGIARFPQSGNLPSRIILYDGNIDLDDMKQSLIAHDWQDKLNFLHFPKVEVLPPETSVKAAALAGGSEIAASVLAMQAKEGQSEKAETREEVKADESVSSDEAPDMMEEFGFEDVQVREVGQLDVSVNEQPVGISNPTEFEPMSDEVIDMDKSSRRKSLGSVLYGVLGKISGFRPSLPRIPRLKLPRLRFPGGILMILVSVMIVLIGFGLAYWYLPKAEIIVAVSLQPLDREVEFVLDSSLTDIQDGSTRLPARVQEISVTGQKEISATGRRTVGERARGTVTIFNRTNSTRSFDAGTSLSVDNLTFTTDEAVTIASASARENPDFSMTIEPSRANVSVTASDIGSEYNIAQNTQLAVANFASESYVARAANEFSGGSSRQISAVSQQDHETLLDGLTQELNQELRNEIGELETATIRAVAVGQAQVEAESYSHDVGDQASNVNLSMGLTQTVYTYDLTHVTLLAQQAAADSIPGSMRLQPNETEVEIIGAESENGVIAITARVTLMLYREIDQQSVAENLRGKTPSQAEAYLRTLPNYTAYQAEFSPRLPALIHTFPRQSQNITVRISPSK